MHARTTVYNRNAPKAGKLPLSGAVVYHNLKHAAFFEVFSRQPWLLQRKALASTRDRWVRCQPLRKQGTFANKARVAVTHCCQRWTYCDLRYVPRAGRP